MRSSGQRRFRLWWTRWAMSSKSAEYELRSCHPCFVERIERVRTRERTIPDEHPPGPERPLAPRATASDSEAVLAWRFRLPGAECLKSGLLEDRLSPRA